MNLELQQHKNVHGNKQTKNQSEMKDSLTEIKTNLQGFNRREKAENQISDLEIRKQNPNQNSKKKKKKV